MNIALKPEQENFIRAKLQDGKYQSVDSLLAFAFQLLEEHEAKQQKLSELRKKLLKERSKSNKAMSLMVN